MQWAHSSKVGAYHSSRPLDSMQGYINVSSAIDAELFVTNARISSISLAAPTTEYFKYAPCAFDGTTKWSYPANVQCKHCSEVTNDAFVLLRKSFSHFPSSAPFWAISSALCYSLRFQPKIFQFKRTQPDFDVKVHEAQRCTQCVLHWYIISAWMWFVSPSRR